MANIPVEKKSGGGGWWKWLLGLIVAAALIWLLIELFDTGEADMAEVEEPIVAPETDTEPVGAAATSVGSLFSNPEQHVGETFPTTEVNVSSVPTDRGFWITEQGDSLFSVIIDRPEEQPKDINPGATLRVDQGTIRAASYLPEMEGRPLDQTTRDIAQQQGAFLVVDERYINVVGGGQPQPGTDPAQGIQ